MAAGCERILVDEKDDSFATRRPGLDAALAALKPGDTLVVWKLDRIGRPLASLVQLIAALGDQGINFRSLADPIDTSDTNGHPLLNIVQALAEYERSFIAERTHTGLIAARKRGQRLGRKPSLTPEQIAFARRLIENGESPRAVARSLKVGKSTLYRHLPAAPGAEANL